MINTRITDVVKHLLIINVLFYFIVGHFGLMENVVLHYPGSKYFEPYQLVTHMFMHHGGRHLIFNMLMLFFIGPFVEQYIGAKRFFILYILSGIGALALHFGLDMLMQHRSSLVGASGAINGVLIAFAVLFPNMKMQLLFPPVAIKAKYLALGFIAYDLYSGMFNTNSTVAHFAHLGGAIVGYLIIQYWRKKG